MFPAAMKGLTNLQETLAHFSHDDWRSSLVWEALQDAKDKLVQDIEDVLNMPAKPADFVHWRETHAKPGTVL
jgi:hypothetical protein